MEEKTPKEENTTKGPESTSYQRRMWKMFQVKTKPWLSPKLGNERRSAGGAEGGKNESVMWMFKRKKKQLDRVFSSSQPNLSCPPPRSGDPSHGGEPVPSTSAGHHSQRLYRTSAAGPTGSKPELTAHGGSPKLAVSQLILSHQKSSSLGSACFEQLVVVLDPAGMVLDPAGMVVDPTGMDEEEEQLRKTAKVKISSIQMWLNDKMDDKAVIFPLKKMFTKSMKGDNGISFNVEDQQLPPETGPTAEQTGINVVGPSNVEPPPRPSNAAMFQLDIILKKGNSLAIRDRTGTSDPYVKFKIGGKEVFKSKTIYKNLNPVWDERVCLLVDTLSEPLYVKVFDYDFGLQDDFMGSAQLHLESLELQRTLDVILELADPHCPDQDLGTIDLGITLTPKEADATMLMGRNWRRSSKNQSMRLSDVHRKSQLWRGIVSISLIEGRNLKAMDTNGQSDPYVKFRLGHQKYKSKTVTKCLNPQWREQFDFHLYEEQGGYIDITVWDKDAGKRDDFMGRCTVDLSKLSREHTHKLELLLEDGAGVLVVLVTLTASTAVSISDMSVNVLDNPHERTQILQRYSLTKSFRNLKDVGVVQVKVIKAEGLMAADVTGKSDPFCVLELSNDRLQTQTVYKNLSPEWNKVFTFNIKDIHSVLEVTVYDEDRDRSADFLGKVAIPLLNIQNGERKAYALKSKELTGPTKGVIFLEIDVIFNAIKASIRTINPIEQKYIEEESKMSKQLLLQNFNRVRRCVLFLINTGCFINSCFQWESPQRSICAFMLYVLVVWSFELYMIPLALLLPLVWNYLLIASGKDTRQDVQAVEDLMQDDDDDFDKDDKDPKADSWDNDRLPESHILQDILASWHIEWIRLMLDSERKGFMDKLYAIQDVCISVQNVLGEVASYGERIKNTFNWTVPFLTWLLIVALGVVSLLLYYIPLRYILLAWGVNKFTKKLRAPYSIDNNEVLDFLSRVPSDIQLVQYHELKLEPSLSPNKRRKNTPGSVTIRRDSSPPVSQNDQSDGL